MLNLLRSTGSKSPPPFAPPLPFCVGVCGDICYSVPCKPIHPQFSNGAADLWFHMWEWFSCARVYRRSPSQQAWYSRKILLVSSKSSLPGGGEHPGKRLTLGMSPTCFCSCVRSNFRFYTFASVF